MNQKDEDVEQASRILRLLQIQSVRELQTIINESIVEIQSLTTETPKVDIRLGQVGRWLLNNWFNHFSRKFKKESEINFLCFIIAFLTRNFH